MADAAGTSVDGTCSAKSAREGAVVLSDIFPDAPGCVTEALHSFFEGDPHLDVLTDLTNRFD